MIERFAPKKIDETGKNAVNAAIIEIFGMTEDIASENDRHFDELKKFVKRAASHLVEFELFPSVAAIDNHNPIEMKLFHFGEDKIRYAHKQYYLTPDGKIMWDSSNTPNKISRKNNLVEIFPSEYQSLGPVAIRAVEGVLENAFKSATQ